VSEYKGEHKRREKNMHPCRECSFKEVLQRPHLWIAKITAEFNLLELNLNGRKIKKKLLSHKIKFPPTGFLKFNL
jgi:hypothetical protein